MTAASIVIGIIVLCFALFFGTFASERWRCTEGSEKYAGKKTLQMAGIALLVAMVCIFINKWLIVLAMLGVVALCLIRPMLLMKRDGIKPWLYLFYIAMAGIGGFTRIFLCWTIIGIPVKRMLCRAGQVGFSQANLEWVAASVHSSHSEASESLSDVWDAIGSSSSPEPQSESRKQVEVYEVENNAFRTKHALKVNSDGTMYQTDDGEWHRINN